MTPRQHWKNWWKVKASNWCACLAADVDGVEVARTIQIDLLFHHESIFGVWILDSVCSTSSVNVCKFHHAILIKPM